MTLNEQEFRRICTLCEYASGETVDEYCKTHNPLSESDFVKIFRIQNADKIGLRHTVEGIKTTKCGTKERE